MAAIIASARCSLVIVLLLCCASGSLAIGTATRQQLASERRAKLYKQAGIKDLPTPRSAPEDAEEDAGNDDPAAIRRRLLEGAAFDAKVNAAHMAQHLGAVVGERTTSYWPTLTLTPTKPRPDSDKFCQTSEYRKSTLKLLKDAPFIGLFENLRNITRFEGSSITYAKGSYWVVFDSLRAIGKVGLQFQFRGVENALIPEDAAEFESQFEGLQYMPISDSFIAVRESIDHATHGLVPNTEEIKMSPSGDEWTLTRVCPVKFFGLEDTNKGWEGIHYFEKGDERYLMGLCESNFCKTIIGPNAPGLQRGNARLIWTKLSINPNKTEEDSCHWEVIKEIKLPTQAYFLDYAGIAFYPHPFGSQVAVVSQEDAAVWVGKFDWGRMEFLPGGKVYYFPRNDECHKSFCNVEGLTFLDSRRLLFASDRSKSIQPFECMGHDQAVHIMSLP